jgi:hypothetical protein
MGASALWIRKLTHWLPYHRDRYFENLAAAVRGAYRPQFKEDEPPKPTDPQTVRAVANRMLDAFSNRADAAMRAYQQKKAQRRV